MHTMEVEGAVHVRLDMETDGGMVFNEDLQLPSLDCDSSSPKWYQTILLALQHCFVMVGTIVMVSTNVTVVGGTNVEQMEMIQRMMLVAAVNTVLQLYFGARLPLIVGTTATAFIIPFATLDISNRTNPFKDHPEKFEHYIRAVQGAHIIAAIVQFLIGYLGLWGFFTSYLSPMSVIPLFYFVGIGLYTLGFPKMTGCVEFGLPAVVILLIMSYYAPPWARSRRHERFAVITPVFILSVIAWIFTAKHFFDEKPSKKFCRADQFDLISAAPWIHVPRPFHWGWPTFDPKDISVMVAASFVLNIESTAVFIAASRFGEATPIPPRALGHGVGCLGIGTLISGFFGTLAGPAISVENVGLLGLTRVGNRRVIQISAGFMILFSILGKFGAILASIPLGILAAIYCMLYAYLATACLGIQKFCDLNSNKTMFILGSSLIAGKVVPQYFTETFGKDGEFHSLQDNVFIKMVQPLCLSSTTVAVIVAYFLDLTWPHSERRWWEKFTNFNQNTRSQQFYS